MSWQYLCDVDVEPLALWLRAAAAVAVWSSPVSATKPQRIFNPPAELAEPIIDAVLACLPGNLVAHQVMLSRMKPSQSHPLHHDAQRADWITRIHVPLTSNPDAWIVFEGESPVHLQVGKAYTFDTCKRHAFGNDGETDRVHLIFDVLIKIPEKP